MGPFGRAPTQLWLRLFDEALPNVASKSSSIGGVGAGIHSGAGARNIALHGSAMCTGHAVRHLFSSNAPQRNFEALHVLLLLCPIHGVFKGRRRTNRLQLSRAHEVSQKGAEIEEKSCTATVAGEAHLREEKARQTRSHLAKWYVEGTDSCRGAAL